MKQFGEFMHKAQQFQADLDKKTVEGAAGGGMVRIAMRGNGSVTGVKIDPELLSDAAMLEDLLTVAFNDATAKKEALMREQAEEMKKSLHLPFNLPF